MIMHVMYYLPDFENSKFYMKLRKRSKRICIEILNNFKVQKSTFIPDEWMVGTIICEVSNKSWNMNIDMELRNYNNNILETSNCCPLHFHVLQKHHLKLLFHPS
jgi:hypothetical protein